MSTKFREVTERLFLEIAGEPLAEWVRRRRSEGASWRRLERELRDEHRIEISNVTLISWFGHDDRESVA